MDSDNGKKFMGATEQSIKDLHEDITDIKGTLVVINNKLDCMKDWCTQHDRTNILDLATMRSDLDKVKENKAGISKVTVAIISGLSGIVGAMLGFGGLVIVEVIKGIIK